MALGSLPSRGRVIASGLALSLYSLCGAPLSAQPAVNLSPKDIDAAIKFGIQGNPTPYVLHHRSGNPVTANPVAVGAVYTPFLRVALAARAAQERGEPFTPNDIAPSLVESLAYIALRWYCCVDQEHGDLANWHPLEPFDYKVASPGEDGGFSARLNRLNNLNLERPVWVSKDLSILATFGAKLPYEDIVLIAAYPVSALKANMDIVIYRELNTETGSGRIQENGRITADDLAHWR